MTEDKPEPAATESAALSDTMRETLDHIATWQHKNPELTAFDGYDARAGDNTLAALERRGYVECVFVAPTVKRWSLTVKGYETTGATPSINHPIRLTQAWRDHEPATESRKARKHQAMPNDSVTDVEAQITHSLSREGRAHYDAMQAQQGRDRNRGPNHHIARGVCWPAPETTDPARGESEAARQWREWGENRVKNGDATHAPHPWGYNFVIRRAMGRLKDGAPDPRNDPNPVIDPESGQPLPDSGEYCAQMSMGGWQGDQLQHMIRMAQQRSGKDSGPIWQWSEGGYAFMLKVETSHNADDPAPKRKKDKKTGEYKTIEQYPKACVTYRWQPYAIEPLEGKPESAEAQPVTESAATYPESRDLPPGVKVEQKNDRAPIWVYGANGYGKALIQRGAMWSDKRGGHYFKAGDHTVESVARMIGELAGWTPKPGDFKRIPAGATIEAAAESLKAQRPGPRVWTCPVCLTDWEGGSGGEDCPKCKRQFEAEMKAALLEGLTVYATK